MKVGSTCVESGPVQTQRLELLGGARRHAAARGGGGWRGGRRGGRHRRRPEHRPERVEVLGQARHQESMHDLVTKYGETEQGAIMGGEGLSFVMEGLEEGLRDARL